MNEAEKMIREEREISCPCGAAVRSSILACLKSGWTFRFPDKELISARDFAGRCPACSAASDPHDTPN